MYCHKYVSITFPIHSRKQLLAEGNRDREDMWLRIIEMESKANQFRFEFRLNEFPTELGLIIIRGPRQYGKSTWLDMNNDIFNELVG
jgi:predicted AAA+ superfamily ATPase